MDTKKEEELAKKVKDGISTQEEELTLLKFLNQGASDFRTFIKNVMVEEKNKNS